MKFELKYRILLLKKYWDTGYSQSHYIKYAILFLGLATEEWWKIAAFLPVYVFACTLFGWWWVQKGWYEADQEIGNRFNKFQKQVREELLKKKKFK